MTTLTLTVRADELQRGDVIPLAGVVGTVADVIVYGGTLPRVDVIAYAGSAGRVRDVFAPDRPIVIERTDTDPWARDDAWQHGRI